MGTKRSRQEVIDSVVRQTKRQLETATGPQLARRYNVISRRVTEAERLKSNADGTFSI